MRTGCWWLLHMGCWWLFAYAWKGCPVEEVSSPLPWCNHHSPTHQPITQAVCTALHCNARTLLPPHPQTVQERVLYARGDAASWKQNYYMPSSADVAVSSWRRWLDKHGAALPVLPRSADDLPPRLPRSAVFDRLHQHTRDCPHCSGALRAATAAAVAAAALAALSGGGAIVAAAASMVSAAAAAPASVGAPPAWLAGGLAVLSALCGVVLAGLLKLRQLFIGIDYVHADVH